MKSVKQALFIKVSEVSVVSEVSEFSEYSVLPIGRFERILNKPVFSYAG